MDNNNNTSVEKIESTLSPAEFRAYNRLAEKMDLYHNYFRQTWNQLYDACRNNKRPAGLSIRQFLHLGLDFCWTLATHHSIEEQVLFPFLAKKMPEFAVGVPGNDDIDAAANDLDLDLLQQHKEIHAGMDRLEDYLQRCRVGEDELRLQEVKRLMDGFAAVLWTHLDEEVRTLRAENMRKYWTLAELKKFPV
ncbi:hypothetical protein Egran_04471 [Elaphomyces granulatus]|uniref:Hemerythrin-like domain-containing protein n=1 Tax=Elaphomyces granulatus TaxID=519963 RepID=A0A232LUK1_9EURO|nr:hypothetical protein Egran_04471 [Elaphomyces granulatus]